MFVVDDEVPEVDEVDAKLVALARKLQLRLLTNDINLAKVAELQGVPAVIPRRLAADLIPGVLAGESLTVSLTRPGRHPGQGVGFLDDGSMVVVNGGENLVGAGPVSLVVSSIVPDRARAAWCSPAPTTPVVPIRGRRRRRRLRRGRARRHRVPEPDAAEDEADATLVAPVLTGGDLGDRRGRRLRRALRRGRSSS